MEALDLAAGLGVVRRGVLGDDAEPFEFGLEEDLALARLAAEDGAVVGEHGGGQTVGQPGGGEAVDHVGGLDGHKGIGDQQQPGVVVDAVEDLDAAAVGELPVGGVGLPELIGELRRRSG